MGAWNATSFGNDSANDWAYELEKYTDLTLIERTLEKVLVKHTGEYIDVDEAAEAIAAAEVLAWLNGKPTPVDAYTEKVAKWVELHPRRPSRPLLKQAIAALDRITIEPSEVLEFWGGNPKGFAAVADLRSRLA